MDLSICIVNWNAQKFLIDCLESICNSKTALNYEVIVVDNASSDDSVRLVKKRFPKVRVIECKKNEGFTVGNNLAIQHSSGRHVLLLNPDTLVTPGSLEAMVKFMDSNKHVGACGCRLFNPETGWVEASARSFPTLLPLLWNLSYLDRLFSRSSFFNKYLMTYLPDNEIREVDWVTGACLMVNHDVIEQVGGLDENIFMYCEDAEWCYRIKQAGWAIYYYPAAEIAHYRGQSSKLRREHHDYSLSLWGAQQYTSSILYFYAKHYGEWRTFLLRIIIVVTSLFKAFLWLTGSSMFQTWPIGWRRARSYLSMIPVALISKYSAIWRK
jgi:hypothetical protein